ncbi:hypothetical protein GCM10023185_16370 [Hymenobacter saemangeumensis]|uniref:Gliding motility-associated C-terminal domain-containing protein n=1 Tax=Hymenobacter saemangeumensis TaxID=1084522 RepID=A0ABP8I9Y4_9BACT
MLSLGAQASHLLGGEMSYRYLDANGRPGRPFRYELTVGMYINADTVPGSPTQSQVPYGRTFVRVGIYQKGGILDGEALDQLIVPRVSLRFATPQPTPGCPPTTPVRLAVYRDTVELPMSAGGYYAYVTDGTRNAAIRNIDLSFRPSSQENMTLYLDMAPPLIRNASPTFSDTAVALVCQGDTVMLINNATDADGDRLVYDFGVPYSANPSGANTVPPARFVPPPVLVLYAPGYSVSQPFGTAPGNIAQLDASTGLSTYRVLTQGRYVVAVDVSEYRQINGVEVLVGRTRRDIQLVVRVCPAGASPTLAPPSVVPRSYVIEEGRLLSFPLSATTSVPNELLTLKVNSALLDGPGGIDASFNGQPGTVAPGQNTGIVSLQGVGSVGATFVLSSRCGSARPSPYDVVVTATSSDCRKKATSDIFRITIVPAAGPTRLTGDSIICDAARLCTYAPVGRPMGRYRWRARGGTIIGSDTLPTVQVRWNAAPGRAELVLGGISRFGCPLDSLRRQVEVQALPALQVTGSLNLCRGSSTTLTISGGTAAYTVSGGGQVLSSSGQCVLAPLATTTYTIAGSTAAGCPLTTTVTITVDPVLPLTVSGPTVLCAGSSTALAISGGAGSYTLTGGGQTQTGPGPFTLTPAATTSYRVEGVTASGCPTSATVTVVVNPVPPLLLSGATTLCAGSSTTLSVSGGAGTYTLSGGGLSLTGAGPFVLAPPVTTSYTVSGSTADGCPTSGQVTITVNALPPLTIAGNTALCTGSSTSIAVSGGVGSYTLTGGGQTLTGAGPFQLAPAATTSYTVVGTSATGCAISNTFTLSVAPAVSLSVAGNLLLCPGSGSTTLQVTGGTGSYTLSSGGLTLTGAGPFVLAPAATTSYTISGTSAAGCLATATVTVTVPPPASLSVSGALSICAGSAASLSVAGGNGSYTVSGGGQTFTGPGPFMLSPPGTTTYAIAGTSPAGCPLSATATVEVDPCIPPDRSLVFYNIVSANNDGLNDVFTIKNVEFYPGNSLSIFNRWGRQVYSTTNYRNTWGNAPDVSPGVYSYLFRLPDGKVTKGWVEVVK